MARSTKSAYYISTLSVSMILFLLGIIAYTVINIARASERLMGDMCITLLVKEGLGDDKTKTLRDRIAATDGVAKVEYTTKEQAAADFRAYAGEDLRVFLDDNPLPASFEVYLLDDYENPVEPSKVASVLGGYEGVSEVLCRGDLLEQVSRNVYKGRIIAASFMLALLVVSVILIGNTVRMVVHSKRFLIKTMRLVGATDGFIRAPFMREALYQGLSAGVTAWVLLTAVIMAVDHLSPEMPFSMEDLRMLALLYGSVMAVGVIICLVSTALALRRYLNIDNSSLYVY